MYSTYNEKQKISNSIEKDKTRLLIKDVKRYMDSFVIDSDHPCVMAQSMVKQKQIKYGVYNDFNCQATAKALLNDLENYIKNYDFETDRYESYIAAFPNNRFEDETKFENNLWELLTTINNFDDKEWDASVSSNPHDENFSFSIKGHAFYIIGMHPKSSRKSRRTQYPILVFNLHWQFERLRNHGLYNTVRKQIRKRDQEFSGSINPMLKDFGDLSEALQYSGKKNDVNWTCPFSANK